MDRSDRAVKERSPKDIPEGALSSIVTLTPSDANVDAYSRNHSAAQRDHVVLHIGGNHIVESSHSQIV